MSQFGIRLFLLLLLVAILCQWRISRQTEESHCALVQRVRREGISNFTQGRHRFSDLKCANPALRNPGVVADGRLAFRPIVRSEVPVWRAQLRADWSLLLSRSLRPWPGLSGLSQAVWLGEAGALPGSMFQLYLEGGLLHLLALSGAHLGSLWLLLRLLLLPVAFFAVRVELGRALYQPIQNIPMLLLVVGLVGLNPGNEPLVRAATMFFIHAGLSLKGRRVPSSQLLGVSTAVLICLRPERLASDSFLLSTVATGLLCVWFIDDKKSGYLEKYVSVSVAMPLLMVPWGAFLFAKVPWMAPFNGLVLGWIWGVLWVPVGFLAVALSVFLPGAIGFPLLAGLEATWQAFVSVQTRYNESISWGYVSVIRPTWCELMVLEALIFVSLLFIKDAAHYRLNERPMK